MVSDRNKSRTDTMRNMSLGGPHSLSRGSGRQRLLTTVPQSNIIVPIIGSIVTSISFLRAWILSRGSKLFDQTLLGLRGWAEGLHELLRDFPPSRIIIPFRRPVVASPSTPQDNAVGILLRSFQLKPPVVGGQVCSRERSIGVMVLRP